MRWQLLWDVEFCNYVSVWDRLFLKQSALNMECVTSHLAEIPSPVFAILGHQVHVVYMMYNTHVRRSIQVATPTPGISEQRVGWTYRFKSFFDF